MTNIQYYKLLNYNIRKTCTYSEILNGEGLKNNIKYYY